MTNNIRKLLPFLIASLLWLAAHQLGAYTSCKINVDCTYNILLRYGLLPLLYVLAIWQGLMGVIGLVRGVRNKQTVLGSPRSARPMGFYVLAGLLGVVAAYTGFICFSAIGTPADLVVLVLGPIFLFSLIGSLTTLVVALVRDRKYKASLK
jgi:hypothetical protein